MEPFTTIASISKIASTAATLAKLSEPIARKAVDAVRATKAQSEIASKVRQGLQRLVLDSAKTCAKVRPFLNATEEAMIHEVYAPLSISMKKQQPFTADISKLLQHHSPIIIQGTAGQGKTTLVKYLVCECIVDELAPLMITLRNLNERESIAQYLARQCGVEEDDLRASINFSNFVLFLDGLDEVPSDSRIKIIQEINELISSCPGTAVIMTCRPLEDVKELKCCSLFTVCKLTIDDALSVVSKLPVDDDRKQHFAGQLKDGLFDSHEELLSNPLLLQVGFLVASGLREMPLLKSELYSQAVDALFRRHDSQKIKFTRDFVSGLSTPDLERLFRAFCYVTLMSHRFSFYANQAEDVIRECCGELKLDADPSLILRDIEQGLSLLVQDGLRYSFIHRQLQAYLAVSYALDFKDIPLLVRFVENSQFMGPSDTLQLMAEIDPISCAKVVRANIMWLFKRCPGPDAATRAKQFYKLSAIAIKRERDMVHMSMTSSRVLPRRAIGAIQVVVEGAHSLAMSRFGSHFASAFAFFERRGNAGDFLSAILPEGVTTFKMELLSVSEVARHPLVFGGPAHFELAQGLLTDIDEVIKEQRLASRSFGRKGLGLSHV